MEHPWIIPEDSLEIVGRLCIKLLRQVRHNDSTAIVLKGCVRILQILFLDCHATVYKLPDDPNMTTWGGGGGVNYLLSEDVR